jgi:hypothetical protein
MGLGHVVLELRDLIHIVSASWVPFVLRASVGNATCEQALIDTLIRGKTEQTCITAGATV